MLDNIQDADLTGVPTCQTDTVNSGAGGNVDVSIILPTGALYILKAWALGHNDIAARAAVVVLTDAISTVSIPIETIAAFAATATPLVDMNKVKGSVLLAPGGIRAHATFVSVGANKDCYITSFFHRVQGVQPLV